MTSGLKTSIRFTKHDGEWLVPFTIMFKWIIFAPKKIVRYRLEKLMETAQAQNVVYKNDYVYLVLGMFRPGAVTFMTRLEYEHFPPSKPELNNQFSVHMHRNDGQTYTVLGLPRKYLKQAQKLAERLSLRLQSGVPTSIDLKTQQPIRFPIESAPDSTYTVTTQATYTQAQAHQAIQLEVQEIRRYLEKA